MDEYKQTDPSGYVEIIHNFQDPKASFYADLEKDTHNVELPLSRINNERNMTERFVTSCYLINVNTTQN